MCHCCIVIMGFFTVVSRYDYYFSFFLSFLFIGLILLLFTFVSVLCCPVIQASSDYVVNRGAYGVYFHYKGVLEVVSDMWIHTFDIALPVVKSLPTSPINTAL